MTRKSSKRAVASTYLLQCTLINPGDYGFGSDSDFDPGLEEADKIAAGGLGTAAVAGTHIAAEAEHAAAAADNTAVAAEAVAGIGLVSGTA